MKVKEFLLKSSLNDLNEKYSININRHKDYPNLVQLKYSQIDSPMKEALVRECRGIILDEKNNWEIISYPFDKFFNFGEYYAPEIKWENSKVFEKIDGSIMTLYFYDNSWHVSSASMPDANGKVKNEEFTLNELFWDIWKRLDYKMPENKDYCYIFELTSPYTQIIVPQKDSNIVLIGARNLKTLKEEYPDNFKNNGWNIVKSFNFSNPEELKSACKKLNPMEQEGFVVCDNEFNRVKMKSPQYINIGFLRGIEDQFVNRYMLEIVRTNEGSEFLAYKPEYTEIYQNVKKKYDDLLNELETHYESVKHIEDNREFGIKCKETRIPNIFFSLKKGKVKSIKDALYNMNIKKLEEILELKE